MIPLWILLAIAGGIISNVSNFLNRYILKDDDDATVYAWLTEVIRLVIPLCIVFFDFSLKLEAKGIILLVALSFIELVSVYYYMKMHAYSHLSLSVIISRTRLVWVPIIAFFFLQEHLRVQDYIGIIILFCGISTVSAPHKIAADKGMQYAYLSAFIVAIESVIIKAATPYASASVILIAQSLASVLFMPLFMKRGHQRIRTTTLKNNAATKVLASLSMTVGGYFFYIALASGPVSSVQALYQSMLVLSVLMGIILLKERKDILRKCIGTAVTLGGIFLLLF